MRTTIPPEVDMPAGEEWWRGFNDDRATAELTTVGRPLKEMNGLEGAMDMFLAANRKCLEELLVRQGMDANYAGSLAVNSHLRSGIYN